MSGLFFDTFTGIGIVAVAVVSRHWVLLLVALKGEFKGGL